MEHVIKKPELSLSCNMFTLKIEPLPPLHSALISINLWCFPAVTKQLLLRLRLCGQSTVKINWKLTEFDFQFLDRSQDGSRWRTWVWWWQPHLVLPLVPWTHLHRLPCGWVLRWMVHSRSALRCLHRWTQRKCILSPQLG